MSNMKHTPEPWAASHRHIDAKPTDDEISGLGWEIEGPEPATNRGQFYKAADAHRIVACVNALAGIADPAAFVQDAARDKADAERYRWLRDNGVYGKYDRGPWYHPQPSTLPALWVNLPLELGQDVPDSLIDAHIDAAINSQNNGHAVTCPVHIDSLLKCTCARGGGA